MPDGRRALKERNEDHVLDQGEVFSNVPLFKWKDGEAKIAKGRVIVSSHGCVCEDYERALGLGRTSTARKVFVQVIPLQGAGDFKDKIEIIERGEMPDLFYVEGDGSKLTHQVANLTREQAVPAEVLVGCTRVAQVADWQWEAFRLHLTLTRFRLPPDQIFRADLLKSCD